MAPWALALLAGVVLATVVAVSGRPPLVVRWLQHRFPDVVFYGPTTERVVALTIDDAPSTHTAEIVDVLDRAGATATFFILGEHAEVAPEALPLLIAGGHELGNHFEVDQATVRLPAAEADAQLVRTDRLIAGAGAARWARPGSGWFDRALLDVVERRGYRLVLGSVYPFDAHVSSTAFIERFVLRKVHPGAIVVLHDGEGRGQRTAAVLRDLLPALHRRGYRVVTVSALLDAAPE